MSTFDKIDFILKQQGKKQIQLCQYIGVGKNRYTDWKAGRIKSYTKYLPKIAEFLGVSVDYIVGNTENPINEDELEEDVIVWHRNGEVGRAKLSKENYDAIVQMIKATSEKPKDEDI